MDVLMRRYARGAKEASVSTEHLDADELNAFAEGALPAVTRSRYVSHLADCHDCRTVASQMAMAAGAGALSQIPPTEDGAKQTWWEKLSALLSAPALRYAASAVILLAVVGVAFVVWRRTAERPNSALIARNEGPNPTQAPAALSTPPVSAGPQTKADSSATFRDAEIKTHPVAPVAPAGETAAAAEPPPPKPAKDAGETETTIAADRMMKSARPDSSPSYAPPPPGEYSAADSRQRNQQVQPQANIGGALHGGPRRNESQDKYKTMDERARNLDLAQGRDEDRSKVAADQPKTTENKQAAGMQSAPAPGTLAARSTSREMKEEARKSDASGRADSNEPISVGGRKFRRQGGVWVDLKFKSSMPITTVARGSEGFEALDSKLQSIGRQLGGEVIVVWKGKAYRLR
jgi:hypothetical protein